MNVGVKSPEGNKIPVIKKKITGIFIESIDIMVLFIIIGNKYHGFVA